MSEEKESFNQILRKFQLGFTQRYERTQGEIFEAHDKSTQIWAQALSKKVKEQLIAFHRSKTNQKALIKVDSSHGIAMIIYICAQLKEHN